MATSTLFTDQFEVKYVNREGVHFDKVSRLECHSETYETQLVLDINSEIYPVKVGEKFTLLLASTLNTDGAPETGSYQRYNKPSLLDKFEYVMHGKVFKMKEEAGAKIAVFVSYGGLLMTLKGAQMDLSKIQLDAMIYLLIRKV